MRYLRYVLLLASLVACLSMLGWMKTWFMPYWHDVVAGLLLAAYPALTFLYVLEHPPNGQSGTGRIARMFALWLNAKENELRSRATPHREG